MYGLYCCSCVSELIIIVIIIIMLICQYVISDQCLAMIGCSDKWRHSSTSGLLLPTKSLHICSKMCVHCAVQWRSVGYRRQGRTAILPHPKVVRCLMQPYHTHFCCYHPIFAAITPIFWHHPHFSTLSWVSSGANSGAVRPLTKPLVQCLVIYRPLKPHVNSTLAS